MFLFVCWNNPFVELQISYTVIKNNVIGASSEVPGLRIHLPTQGRWVWSRVREDPTRQGTPKSVWPTAEPPALEPTPHSSRGLCSTREQDPLATTRERRWAANKHPKKWQLCYWCVLGSPSHSSSCLGSRSADCSWFWAIVSGMFVQRTTLGHKDHVVLWILCSRDSLRGGKDNVSVCSQRQACFCQL